MTDLLVRNATLPDGRTDVDILIEAGRIAATERALPACGCPELDAGGYLVSPPFVDPHFHMDATLSLGLPRMNESGTLLEGIALWGELKPLLIHEAVVERALRRWCTRQTQGEMAPNPKLLRDDRLATDGSRASGRQHPVQHRHANGSLSLLGREAAGSQTRSDQRLVTTHCRFH